MADFLPDEALFTDFTSGKKSPMKDMGRTVVREIAYGEKGHSWWLDQAAMLDTKGYEKRYGKVYVGIPWLG